MENGKEKEKGNKQWKMETREGKEEREERELLLPLL